MKKVNCKRCQDCGSYSIIDEVVDFCGNCRSYNIGYILDNGKWEETNFPSSIIKNENNLQIRSTEHIKKSINLSLIIDELNLISDTFSDIKRLSKFNYFLNNDKRIPLYLNIPEDIETIKNGNKNPSDVANILNSYCNKIKYYVNIISNNDKVSEDIKNQVVITYNNMINNSQIKNNKNEIFLKNDLNSNWLYNF